MPEQACGGSLQSMAQYLLHRWTIHPLDASHSALTIDASQHMGPVRGLVMRPLLKKLFYGTNLTPFIEEAERLEKESKIQAGSA